MIRVEYFCARCNASAQRRDPGDEVSTGYVHAEYASARDAKRDAPAYPVGWTVDDLGRLACDSCVTLRATATEPSSPPEDMPADPAVSSYRSKPAGWPALSSPFDFFKGTEFDGA
jgi:hypothetical protein